MSMLSWTDRWVGRYEATISLKWKLAWANGLTPKQIDHWISRTPAVLPDRALRLFGKASDEHNILRLTGCFSDYLVSFGPLRYCPECIRDGYVSVFHQLAVLRRCPIHARELRATCKCGTGVQWQRVGSNRPFYCRACNQPIGGVFEASRFIRAGQTIHPLEAAFDPLLDWIRRLQASPYRFSVPQELKEFDWELLRRERTGWLLQGIAPLDMDPHFLHGPRAPLSVVCLTQEPRDMNPSFVARLNKPEIYRPINIVRRRILKHHLKGLKRHGHVYKTTGRVCDNGLTFRPPPGVHPLVHAYWVWRYFLGGEARNPVDFKWDSMTLKRNANRLRFRHGTQVTDCAQLHYLLGTYYEFVWQTLEALRLDLLSEAEAAHLDFRDCRAQRRKGDHDMPLSGLSMYPCMAWLTLAEVRGATWFDDTYHYFHVSRDIAEAARALGPAPPRDHLPFSPPIAEDEPGYLPPHWRNFLKHLEAQDNASSASADEPVAGEQPH